MAERMMKVAVVQMDVVLGDLDANQQRIDAWLQEAARRGAALAVFPECALTGYTFDSLEEARGCGEPIPGPHTRLLAETCRRLGIHAVVGLLETDGPRLFNACALLGPEGVAASYRKIHLPTLGVDRFTTPGDRPFGVHPVGPARVGMHICYDGSFPESARVMALQGADLIVLPTNWPPGSECAADYMIPTRAMENHVYYAVANRVGTERGFRFIGRSAICAPGGMTLARAGDDEQTMLVAEVDVEQARNKRLIRVPGKHEIDRFADRRPEMYGPIAAGRSDDG